MGIRLLDRLLADRVLAREFVHNHIDEILEMSESELRDLVQRLTSVDRSGANGLLLVLQENDLLPEDPPLKVRSPRKAMPHSMESGSSSAA